MLYAAAARRAVHETKEKGKRVAICNPFSPTTILYTLYSVFISAVLGRVRRCGRTIYKFVIIDRSSRASERCTHKTTKTTQHRTVQTPNPKPQTPNRKPQTAKRFSLFALRISAHFRAFPRFRFSFRWFLVFGFGFFRLGDKMTNAAKVRCQLDCVPLNHFTLPFSRSLFFPLFNRKGHSNDGYFGGNRAIFPVSGVV